MYYKHWKIYSSPTLNFCFSGWNMKAHEKGLIFSKSVCMQFACFAELAFLLSISYCCSSATGKSRGFDSVNSCIVGHNSWEAIRAISHVIPSCQGESTRENLTLGRQKPKEWKKKLPSSNERNFYWFLNIPILMRQFAYYSFTFILLLLHFIYLILKNLTNFRYPKPSVTELPTSKTSNSPGLLKSPAFSILKDPLRHWRDGTFCVKIPGGKSASCAAAIGPGSQWHLDLSQQGPLLGWLCCA